VYLHVQDSTRTVNGIRCSCVSIPRMKTRNEMSAWNSTDTSWSTVTPSSGIGQPLFVITPDLFQRVSFIINGVLTPIICITGLVGNSLGLWVLSRDPSNRRQTIYTYMFALMICDNVFLFVGFFTTTMEVIGWFDQELRQRVQNYYIIFGGYAFLVLKHVSSFVLIIMAFERVMALCRPFRTKSSYLSTNPYKSISLTVAVTVVYLIPFFAGFRIIPVQNNGNSTTETAIIVPEYLHVFHVYTFIETVILHYICPGLLLLLNVMIVTVYSRHRKQRSSLRMNRTRDNQLKITTIVVCVAGMYIFLSLPNMFLQTLIFIDDNYSFYGRHHLTFFLFTSLGDLLARINAATDFFIYVGVSNHYRGGLRTVACKCCQGEQRITGRQQHLWSSSTTSTETTKEK